MALDATAPTRGRPTALRLGMLIEQAEEATAEAQSLRAERQQVGRYLTVVGGRLARLIEAEQLPQARHVALEVASLGERLARRGTEDAA